MISVHDRLYLVTFCEGLESIVRAELSLHLSGCDIIGSLNADPRRDELVVSYSGDFRNFLRLRTAVSVYRVLVFPGKRPTALLGNENFRAISSVCREIMKQEGRTFQSFALSGAGRGSGFFQKFSSAFQAATALVPAPEKGDLDIRILPTSVGPGGWGCLLRLSPKPLSARRWREENFRGALNATIAAAMLKICNVQAQDAVLNICCGSGTLAIEAALTADPPAHIVALDHSAEALRTMRRNCRAAGPKSTSIRIVRGDLCQLPFVNHSFTIIVSDLPWGEAIGKRESLNSLYQQFIEEAVRLLRPRGSLAVITQRPEIFKALSSELFAWHPELELKVFQGGFRPSILCYRALPQSR